MQLKLHKIDKGLPVTATLKISSSYAEEYWIMLLNTVNLLSICRILLNCWRTHRSGQRKIRGEKKSHRVNKFTS